MKAARLNVCADYGMIPHDVTWFHHYEILSCVKEHRTHVSIQCAVYYYDTSNMYIGYTIIIISNNTPNKRTCIHVSLIERTVQRLSFE